MSPCQASFVTTIDSDLVKFLINHFIPVENKETLDLIILCFLMTLLIFL